MSNTQQPEALNLEEFRAKVTHAACEPLLARIAELEAARIAYASEFKPDADGEPDVGNIHANIRALKAQLSAIGAEVRGKTLRDAITKAIAAQAKKGE